MGFLTDFLSRKVVDAEMQTITAEAAKVLYYKELAFYIAKSYIANAISKCEFKVYENNAEKQNELYYALNVEPNPNQNSSQFLNQLINTLYDKNEVLVVPIKNRLYVADSFSIEEHPLKENIFTGVTIEKQSLPQTFKASKVFYFKLEDKSVKQLLDGVYETYSQMLASSIASYKRGNGQKYKLILEQTRAGDTAFVEQFNTVIKKQLQAFMENENAVYPQFKGQELVEMAGSTQTADDFLKVRKEIFEIVAQSMKIPLPMMYGNITNIQEIVKVFITFCIDPLCDMLSEELTRKINTYETWKENKLFVRVDTSRINHIDILDVADKADKLIASGICSIDDLRETLDKPLLNTEFSKKHWVTKNYSDVETEQAAGNVEQQTGGEEE
jgi:HK97 family phage portal protein